MSLLTTLRPLNPKPYKTLRAGPSLVLSAREGLHGLAVKQVGNCLEGRARKGAVAAVAAAVAAAAAVAVAVAVVVVVVVVAAAASSVVVVVIGAAAVPQ